MNIKWINMWGIKQGLIGVLLFLLPFLSLVTLWGISLCSFLFIISALVLFADCRAALARHWPAVRWVVAAFLFNCVFVLLCYLLRPEALQGNIEKPVRMLLAVSALAAVLVCKPDRNFLWWGAIAGAAAGALLVLYQRVALGLDRPGGLINPITFGDLVLCLGLVSLAAAIDMRGAGRAAWAGLGVLAGLAGTLLTGTRGGWIVLPLAAFVFIRYSDAVGGRRIRTVLLAGFALVAATWFVPASGVRERVRQGETDVSTYFAGGSAFSNVGIRLELWKAASLLIAERPLLGADMVTVKADIDRHVRAGRVDPVVLPVSHFHNDAVQALVTGGVVGLFAWLSILAAPLLFFVRALRSPATLGRQQVALALAGMLVVLCYFSFGMTEVIFWSVKGSLFYALMIFMLMGLCLNAKEKDGK
jgi:O-antigen ligase